MIAPKEIQELLIYFPESGLFKWKDPSKKLNKDLFAGCESNGYRQVTIHRRKYNAHRVAWAWMTGEWPKHEIDHINGVRDDNRWSNLQHVTRFENQQNQHALHADRKHGKLRGACRCKFTGRWQAHIVANGKQFNLGRYDTEIEAHQAYLAAKLRLHKTSEVAKVASVA